MKTSKVICVLGAGRSGTSLLMQILVSMGVSVSENLVSARYSNTEGSFEDKDISNFYFRTLFPTIGGSIHTPFDFETHKMMPGKYDETINFLSDLLKKNIKKSEGNFLGWAFKHPGTGLLLPYWLIAFNRTAVIPKFFLMVRNPTEVFHSRMNNFGDNESLSALAWLINTAYSIFYTSGNIFIMHYHDLLAKPKESIHEIGKYIGIELNNQEILIEDTVGLVNKQLNRSITNKKIESKLVSKFYERLINCRYDHFNRENLIKDVTELIDSINEFKGWALLSQKKQRELNTHKSIVEKYTSIINDFEKLKIDNQRNNQLKYYLNLLHKQLNNMQL